MQALAFYSNGVSIGGVIVGLILAVIVYLVLEHFTPQLLAALAALLVFLAAAGLV